MDTEADRYREVAARLSERVQELEADNRQLINALVKALTLLDKVAGQPTMIIGPPDPQPTPGFTFTEAFESIRRGAEKRGRAR